jgi:multidrug transporter EmrE-like cation transporter
MSLLRILGLTLIEIVGDTGAKNFSNQGGLFNLGMGITGYIGIFMMLIYSLQGSSLLVVNNAWDGMSSLISSLYSYFILGERLQYTYQYLGIVFIIGGLLLLKIPIFNENEFKMPTL